MSALLYATALVDAHLGRVEEARDAAERGSRSRRAVETRSSGSSTSPCSDSSSSPLGDAAAADGILRPLAARLASSGWREPSIYGELPNAIEALVELGELAEARRFLADLQSTASSRIESPWAEASAGRCEGLILAAEGDLEARSPPMSALSGFMSDCLSRSTWPVRCSLRASPSGGRGSVAQVARRSSGRSPSSTSSEPPSGRRRPGPSSAASAAAPATPAISRRASGGLPSSSPKARRTRRSRPILVLADRTVESALTQIYRKLEVRSRTELARKLVAPAEQSPGVSTFRRGPRARSVGRRNDPLRRRALPAQLERRAPARGRRSASPPVPPSSTAKEPRCATSARSSCPATKPACTYSRRLARRMCGRLLSWRRSTSTA